MESAVVCFDWLQFLNLAANAIIVPLVFSVAVRLSRWEYEDVFSKGVSKGTHDEGERRDNLP